MISVVIGTNYGDEGKGLVVDFLSTGETLVVRFNGGAQAAHTVVTPDGKRHVFSHLGSGFFRGARTYLSNFFVVHPSAFIKEYDNLMEFDSVLDIHPVLVDPRCKVTTPYDIMINQELERIRGKDKHGSCGVGFNETLQRNQYGRYGFTFKDLQDRALIKKKLERIRTGWIKFRQLDLDQELDLPYLMKDDIIERYMEDVEKMLCKTVCCKPLANYEDSEFYKGAVFEGAQGLQLDMHNQQFPYVTRSKTGLANVIELLEDAGVDNNEQINIFYVTRTYLTRHGAGPMPHEYGQPYKYMGDTTNIYNKYQGNLRYSFLDVSYLADAIEKDLKIVSGLNVNVNLVLTHCDQLDHGLVQFVHRKNKCALSLQKFVKFIGGMIDVDRVYTTFGPTRNDFHEHINKS